MLRCNDLAAVKRLALLFWAAWLSVVATTNVLDAMRAAGVVAAGFRFASGNWAWINQTMDPLAVPRGLQAALYAGAVAWEALAAALFWRALAAYRRPDGPAAALAACGVNLGLWAAFQVLDEVFLAYQPEAVHRAIFVSQLVTLFLLRATPDAWPAGNHDGGAAALPE